MMCCKSPTSPHNTKPTDELQPNQPMNCKQVIYYTLAPNTIPTSLNINTIYLNTIKFGYHTSSQNINIKLQYLTILY